MTPAGLSEIDEVDADDADTNESNTEAGYCVHCDGSGEGQYDGTRCHWCKGKGE